MYWRPPLQQLESFARAMAPATASAGRALRQRCVRELRGGVVFSGASSARMDAVFAGVARSAMRTEAPISVAGGILGRVPEHFIFRSSFSCGGSAVARSPSWAAVEGGRIWCSAGQGNFAASVSFISGDRLSTREQFFYRLNAMPLSTLPAREHNVSQNVPTENVTSIEVDSREGEPSSELDLALENESSPSTPLVQAQESISEYLSSAVGQSISADLTSTLDRSISTDLSSTLDQKLTSPLEQVGDVFTEAQLPSAAASHIPNEIDSDLVVQPGRVYIGGLPFQMKGEELRDALRELCGKYGTVMDVNLAQHRHQSQKSIEAGKHRGFAFVMMETPEQARGVIDKLNGASVWGRVLTVSYGLRRTEVEPSDTLTGKPKPKPKTLPRCKVFVGNLHEGTSAIDLRAKFQQYGAIVDVKLITELHSNRSRGFGFVTFTDEDEAVKAVLDCDGVILDGSVIRVNIAKYPQGY